MALDVRRLRVLREVAAQGSFSAAAEALAFTQPAVSRQIATLEAEAGARLVERSARGIRLTPAGELLVEHAEAILGRLAAAEAQLEALAGLGAGRLRLGSFPTANATLAPLAIAAFADAHPGVELRLTEATSADSVALLAAGELDLAVVSDAPPVPDAPPDVELEHLMDDPQYLALPRKHPLANAPQVRMHDLRDETWIEGRDPVCSEPLLTAARAAGFEPRIAFESAQWVGKQGLVAAGVGVTLIPTVALATVRDGIVLRSLGDDAPVRRVFIATHATNYRAPAVEPMKAVLRRVAREHCFTCDAMVAETPVF
jgi:DNA-binding transcriptional LysR family regulator